MKNTFVSRLTSLSFASLMTLAMLLSVDSLATRDVDAQSQLASVSAAQPRV